MKNEKPEIRDDLSFAPGMWHWICPLRCGTTQALTAELLAHPSDWVVAERSRNDRRNVRVTQSDLFSRENLTGKHLQFGSSTHSSQSFAR